MARNSDADTEAVLKAVNAFDAFRDAYAKYVREVVDALSAGMDDESMEMRVRSLVDDSGDIARYILDREKAIDFVRLIYQGA